MTTFVPVSIFSSVSYSEKFINHIWPIIAPILILKRNNMNYNIRILEQNFVYKMLNENDLSFTPPPIKQYKCI